MKGPMMWTMIRPTQKQDAKTGAKQPFLCRKPNMYIQNGICFTRSIMWCSLPLKLSQVRSSKSNLPSLPTTHSGIPSLLVWSTNFAVHYDRLCYPDCPSVGAIDRRSCTHTVFFVLSSDTIVHSILWATVVCRIQCCLIVRTVSMLTWGMSPSFPIGLHSISP